MKKKIIVSLLGIIASTTVLASTAHADDSSAGAGDARVGNPSRFEFPVPRVPVPHPAEPTDGRIPNPVVTVTPIPRNPAIACGGFTYDWQVTNWGWQFTPGVHGRIGTWTVVKKGKKIVMGYGAYEDTPVRKSVNCAKQDI